MKTLYQIILSYATFGIIVENNIVKDVAPIASWTKNKKWPEVKSYYERCKNAKIIEVENYD